MTRQLKAFTLLELLVGMIVSSIVIAATFSSWRIISRQHLLYRTRHDASQEASFFCSALRRDMALAIAARGSNDELWLTKSERTLHYRNGNGYVVRDDQQKTDTFFVDVSKWVCSYHTQPLNDNGTTDRIELEIQVNQTPLSLVLVKPESAEEKMKHEFNPEESNNGY